jgi:hypothetical protein
MSETLDWALYNMQRRGELLKAYGPTCLAAGYSQDDFNAEDCLLLAGAIRKQCPWPLPEQFMRRDGGTVDPDHAAYLNTLSAGQKAQMRQSIRWIPTPKARM